MKLMKDLMIGIILIIVGMLFLILAPGHANADIITVDAAGNGDYLRIQHAVDNATEGDTIRVFGGIYPENIILDKGLDIIGNGTFNSTIDGMGTGYVIRVSSAWVNISDLRIMNGSEGIHVENAHCEIHEVEMLNLTGYGISASSDGSWSVNATHNEWGDDSGPYHPEYNTGGAGVNVSGHVRFSPWYDSQRKLNHHDLELQIEDTRKTGEPDSYLYFDIPIINSGTQTDNYSLSLSGIPDEMDAFFQNGSSTGEIPSNDQQTIRVLFYLHEGAPPGEHPCTVTVSAISDVRISKDIILTVVLNRTYGISILEQSDIYTVSPSHDQPGICEFSIAVRNTGNSADMVGFEVGYDSDSQKYKNWISLPETVKVNAGSFHSYDFQIKIQPIDVDPLARADGKMKNLTIIGFSQHARDDEQEGNGNTSDSYLCGIHIREYQYARFTSIVPEITNLEDGKPTTVNVSIRNEGNGQERYFFQKEGEDGGGLNTEWYDFNVTSVLLDPFEIQRVSIHVDLPRTAHVGAHSFDFHASSESSFKTDSERFSVVFPELCGGEFMSATNRSSDPGRTVRIDVSVRNTGNAPHDFKMGYPLVPEGWDNPSWSGGNIKQIDGDSSGSFTIDFDIPDDFTKAKAGLHQFQLDGFYEDEGGSETKFAKSITLNLTVNTIYGVEVGADDYEEEAKPGDLVIFQVKVRNSGNVNETYQLSALKASGNLENAKPWTTIVGTEPGNLITLSTGETRYLDIHVAVPEFTEENDEAEEGLYGVKIKAESTNDSQQNDERIFELEVEEMFAVDLWADVPGKSGTLMEIDDIEMTFTLYIRNFGNTDDDIVVTVPNDEFYGEKRDWRAKFGTQTSKTVTLRSLSQQSVTLTLTIDRDTDPGEYTLRVRAESQGDTTIYDYTTIYINLTKATYGVQIEKFPTAVPKVNPSDGSEIEFKFTLTNTGNQDDTYTVEVETPLGSGIYKGWVMEFEDNTDSRVDQLSIPTDIKSNADLYLSKNRRVDITLYVTVASDADEDTYSEIAVSATSNNDNSQVQYLYFELTVILPNIRLFDSPDNLYFEPTSDIGEDDSIDITVRVFNDGGDETGRFYVFFYNGRSDSPDERDGDYFNFERVDNIPADQYYDLSTEWDRIPSGENDIFVYADKPISSGNGKTTIDGSFSSDGFVIESNEDDNTISISDPFQEAIDLRPDLTILGVEYSSRASGSSSRVIVEVANIGTADTGSLSASIWVTIEGENLKGTTEHTDDSKIAERINTNDAVKVQFIWYIPKRESNFSVRASVDHPDDRDPHNGNVYVGYVVTTPSHGSDQKDTTWAFVGISLIIGLFLGIGLILGYRYRLDAILHPKKNVQKQQENYFTPAGRVKGTFTHTSVPSFNSGFTPASPSTVPSTPPSTFASTAPSTSPPTFPSAPSSSIPSAPPSTFASAGPSTPHPTFASTPPSTFPSATTPNGTQEYTPNFAPPSSPPEAVVYDETPINIEDPAGLGHAITCLSCGSMVDSALSHCSVCGNPHYQ